MPKPLLFISHKHSDKGIASAISKFLKERALGKIDIFQSSNYEFNGPGLGKNLKAELNKALWRCDVLALIYTSMDNDWSYCMYECGVATHPNSQTTKIIVFQCGKDVPALFKDELRVNARSEEDIKKFTRELLTDPHFFPSLKEAFASEVDKETIENAGKELFINIGKTLPELVNNIEEWPAWPYLRIELPQAEVLKISNAAPTDRLSRAIETVRDYGIIVKNDSRISQIFGLTSVPEKGLFSDLLKVWSDNYPKENPVWFESCCEQIMVGARREFPVIKNVSLKEVNSNLEYTPVMSRVKYLAFANSSQFDIYFYNLNDPRAVPVTNKMIKLEDMFVKRIGKITTESVRLKDLIKELDESGRNRVPFLTDGQTPLYMVHRSMIDQFAAKNVWSGISPADFTLKNLLEDEVFKEMFENTFVLVSKNASLAAAKNAMLSRPNCLDIFITENGKSGEPVIGWLTNNDITKTS